MKKATLIILTSLLTLFSYLIDVYTPFKIYSNNFSLVLLIYSGIVFFITQKGEVKKMHKTRLIYYFVAFGLASYLSMSLTVNEAYNKINVLYILTSFIILTSIKDFEQYFDIFLLSQIIAFMPMLRFVLPMNKIGIIMSYVGTVTYIFILKRFANNTLFMLVNFLITITIILITKSRTALLVFVVISIIILLKSLYKPTIKSLLVLTSTVLVTISLYIVYFKSINQLLFNKWQSGDLSSGRFDIWEFFLGNGGKFISIFGNGDQLVGNYFRVTDTHNIFIQILVQYGWFTFSIFIVFMLLLLIRSYKLYFNSFLFVIWYVLIGIFENITIFNPNFTSIVLPFIVFVIYISLEKEGAYNENTLRSPLK